MTGRRNVPIITRSIDQEKENSIILHLLRNLLILSELDESSDAALISTMPLQLPAPVFLA